MTPEAKTPEAVTPEPMTLQQLRGNLEAVQERIAAAAQRCGRDPAEVRLLAVTKTHPEHMVDLAFQAGMRLFGENRVQEAVAKYGSLPTGPAAGPSGEQPPAPRWLGSELHLIGHLQRNKARLAAGLFGCVQSIDKLDTAEALARACRERGRAMDVLREMNTSGEACKSGCQEEEALLEAAGAVRELAPLRLRGLMTVGPLTEDAGRVASAFARLRRLYERLRSAAPSIDVLSMGMSGDFEIAVQEGATMVRLGTVLFGARSART